jgi:hypothetical protein
MNLQTSDGRIGTTANAVRPAILVGLVAAALCFAWLFLNTHYLYADNWTSVYYTGARTPMPPELADEHIYQFPDVVGYDAQFYHLMAHDPLFKKDFTRFLDDPRLRYRRILVSALAAILSAGHVNWVDPAYIAVVLTFVFLGTFWLARWSASHGLSPAWGLLFLVVPATLATMLLMVVDGALAALAVGAFWDAEREQPARLYFVLACAALVRETGILLVVGYCLWLLMQRKVLHAFLFGTAAVPLFLWLWFVQIHTEAAKVQIMSGIPFRGLYQAVVGHVTYQNPILLSLDFVAIGGMLLALGFTCYYVVRPETRSPAAFMAAGFVVLSVFVGISVWVEANSFGRVLAPVLLFVAMVGLLTRNRWTLLPIALIDLRIGAVLLTHLEKIFHAISAGRS